MGETKGKSQYDKMLTTPIPKLIISLGIPTTISMLVTTVYNLADTYFVGRLGTSASGAIGIVFTLMGILQAIGFMLGQGSGSNISRLLGAKKTSRAGVFASVGFFTSLIVGTLIAIICLVFLTPLMRLLGSTETILPYSSTYARFILYAAPAMTGSCVLNNILRFEGRAAFAMIGLTSGGIINIIGDAIFILGFHTGIEGAGIATAISQYISFFILLSMFLRNKTQSKISFDTFRKYCMREIRVEDETKAAGAPGKVVVGVLISIVLVGLPSLARQGLGSLSTMILNQCCAVYGDAAIAAMSIVSRISFFLFAVGLGIGQGFQPVCGFNYGAGKYDRVKKAFYFTFAFGTTILGIFSAIALALSGSLVQIFRDDMRVVEIGTFALRCQCVALLFVPMCVCSNMLFQSIGKSGRAFFLSCLRSGMFFIPILLILSGTMGLTGIQISQPIADVLAGLVSLPFSVLFLKKLTDDNN